MERFNENVPTTLSDEGETRTITEKRVRRACQECGGRAMFKLCYLLEGGRGNPASSAYRRDDCSWCSDLDLYLCAECSSNGTRHPHQAGYAAAATFPAKERFAHMFLTWKTVDAP